MPAKEDEATAIILAGGLGTRLRHRLPDLPKPLAPVAGRPFLEWILRFLRGQGCRQIVLSIGYLSHRIAAYARECALPGIALECVVETQPLGTGGAFVHTLRNRSESGTTLLVCNGDSLALASLAPILDPVRAGTLDGAVLGVQVADAERFGTLGVDAEGRLVGFREKHPGVGLINAGVYTFRRATVDRFPSKTPLSFEYDVFPNLIAGGVRIGVHAAKAPFIDIGTDRSLDEGADFIQAHREWFE
jgi:D-glycero-alpha-D-manno-heptose 1-phosphate guanylyltransferase